jgi:hypothetical protein
MLQFLKRLNAFIHRIKSFYLFMELRVARLKYKLWSIYQFLLSVRWGKVEIFRTALFIIRHELMVFGWDKASRLANARAKRAYYSRQFTWKLLDAEPFLKQVKRLYLQTRKLSKYTGFIQLYSFFFDAGYIKALGTKAGKKNTTLANLVTVRFSLLDRVVWPIFLYMSEIFETYVVFLQVFGFGFAFLGVTLFSWLPFVKTLGGWIFSSLLNVYGICCWQRISLYMLIKTYVLGLLVYQIYLLADALLYFKSACRLQNEKDPMLFFDFFYTVNHSSGGAFGLSTAGGSSSKLAGHSAPAFWEIANSYMVLTCLLCVFLLCVSPLGFALFGTLFMILHEVLVRRDYFKEPVAAPKEFSELELSGFIDWLSARYPKQADRYARGVRPSILFAPIELSDYLEPVFSFISRISGTVVKIFFSGLSVLYTVVSLVLKYADVGYWVDWLRAQFSPTFRRNYELWILLDEIAEIIEMRSQLRRWGSKSLGELNPLLLTLQQRASLLMDPIYGDGVVGEYTGLFPTAVSAEGANSLSRLESRVYQKLVTLGVYGEDLLAMDMVNQVEVEQQQEETEINLPDVPETFVAVIPGDLSGTLFEKLKERPDLSAGFNAWDGLDEEGSVIMARQRVREQGLRQVLDEENTRLVNWLLAAGVSRQNADWLLTHSLPPERDVSTDLKGIEETIFLSSFDDYKPTEDLLTTVIPLFEGHPFVEYLRISGAWKPEVSIVELILGVEEMDPFFDLLEEIELYSKTGGLRFSYEEFITYCDSPIISVHTKYSHIFTEFFGTILSTFACLVLFFANEHWFYLSSLSSSNIDVLLATVAYKNLAFICDAVFYDYGDSGLLEEYSKFHDTCYALYTLREGLVFPLFDPTPDPAVLEEFPPYPELRHIPLYNTIGGDVIQDNVTRILDAIVPNGVGMAGLDELALYTNLQGLSGEDLIVFDKLFDKRRGNSEVFPGDYAAYREARKVFRDIKIHEEWLHRRNIFRTFWRNPLDMRHWQETLQTAWLDLRKPVAHPDSSFRKPASVRSEDFDTQQGVLLKRFGGQLPRLRLPRFPLPGLRLWLFETNYPLMEYSSTYTQPVRDFLSEVAGRMLYIRNLQYLCKESLVVDPLYLWPLVNIDRYLEYLDYTDLLPEEYLDVAMTTLGPERSVSPIFFQDNLDGFLPIATFAELFTTPEYFDLDMLWDLYYLDFIADVEEPEAPGDTEDIMANTQDEYYLEQLEQERDIDLIDNIQKLEQLISRAPLDEPVPNFAGEVVLDPFWNQIPYDAWADWHDMDEEALVNFLMGEDPTYNYAENDHPLGRLVDSVGENMFYQEVMTGPLSILEQNPEDVEQIRAFAEAQGKELSSSGIFYEFLELRPQSQITIFEEYSTWKHLQANWLKIKFFLYRSYFEDVVELGRGADDFFENLDYDFWGAEQEIDRVEIRQYIMKQLFARLIRLISFLLYKYHTFSLRYINPYVPGDCWSPEVQQNLAEFLE